MTVSAERQEIDETEQHWTDRITAETAAGSTP
jgi:hypothetical protein